MIESTSKADELIEKFKPIVYPFIAGSGYLSGAFDDKVIMENAKQCALIHVDGMIEEINLILVSAKHEALSIHQPSHSN